MQNEIVEIQLDQILLNDNNPRGGINWEYVDVLAASMALDDQKDPIKTRPLPQAEIDKLPPGLDYRKGVDLYMNVGGDHRVLAARKLKWTKIKAIILPISAQEALLEGHLDNQGQPKTWLSDYKVVEATHALYPDMTQQEISDKTMVLRQSVNQALQLMPLLNPAARAAICRLSTNPGKYKSSERVFFALTGLATGTGSRKSPVGDESVQPNLGSRLEASTQVQPNDPDRVAATLTVVIDRQMTESQVKKLVEWVKAGNQPETYIPAPPKPKTPPITMETLTKAAELGKLAGAEESRGDAATTHRDAFKAFMDSAIADNPAPTPTPNTPTSPAGISTPSGSQPAFDSSPLQPISRTEGLAILGQRIGQGIQWLTTLFKPKEPVVSHHAGHAELKALKPEIKWTKKVAEWFAKIAWRDAFKWEHHVFRKIANYIVPVKDFGASSSGHQQSHRQKGLGFSPTTAMALILHWVVYTLLQFTWVWLLVTWVASRFAPSLTRLVQWPFRFLAHEIFVVLFNWVWPGLLHDWVVAAVVALALFGIYNASKAQRMAFLGALLVGIWIYGRGWHANPLTITAASSPAPTTIATAQPTPLVESSAQKPAQQTIEASTQSPAGISSPSVKAGNGSGTQQAAANPTVQPTPTIQKPKTDVAGSLVNQALPGVAGLFGKKLF